MNKKIFTLLVSAAFALGALFTAKAQINLQNHKEFGKTSFADTLRADTAKGQITKGGKYLLSLTDIYNMSGSVATTLDSRLNGVSLDSSYVMFVDDAGQLRIDVLAELDSTTASGNHTDKYRFKYNTSYKFGAMQHASWCVDYDGQSPNVVWNFTSMSINKQLEAPIFASNMNEWEAASEEGYGRYIYKQNHNYLQTARLDSGINLSTDENVVLNDWHFSQSIEPAQKGMPLYVYHTVDSVLVLVLDTVSNYSDPTDNGTVGGGWTVTIKKVAVNDLIQDYTGAVNQGDKKVENVLGFTLKKLQNLVLNADDYNAIAEQIFIEKDAKNSHSYNDGWNPFTTPKNAGTDPHAQGPLTAYEVNDSLYKFGYMQFKSTKAVKVVDQSNPSYGWLYVDTAFWNVGNTEYLRFNWSSYRRDTSVYQASQLSNSVDYGLDKARYWAGSEDYNPDGTGYQTSDSVQKFRQDSIMENQSKFRVVYETDKDQVLINVYQSRYNYKEYPEGYPNVPAIEYPWWTGSFRIDAAGAVTSPSGAIGDTARNSFAAAKPLPHSSPSNMDTVVVSTADTGWYYLSGSDVELAHIYGDTSRRNSPTNTHYVRDSLLYVSIQNLETSNGYKVATLSESGSAAKFKLNFYTCNAQGGPQKLVIYNGLYLIRDMKGRFLSVPLWSLGDSAYWVTPEAYEDPTQMPSYQWVLESDRSLDNGIGSTFKLTNREFPKRNFEKVFVYKDSTRTLQTIDGKTIGGKIALADDYAGIDGRTPVVISEGAFAPKKSKVKLGEGWAGHSFIPLAKDVKEDQILGYTYKTKDETIIDVYALKYLTFLSEGNHLGWQGFGANDSIVYANKQAYHDRLYFALEGMDDEGTALNSEFIAPEDRVVVKGENDIDYGAFYKSVVKGDQQYYTADSIIMEHFGYMPTKKGAVQPGKSQYDTTVVRYLKPLVRQAYRLMQKDYYYFSPTIQGHYMTVGENDNYIMSDKYYARQGYAGNGHVNGVFGVPFFYFRNTNFSVKNVDPAKDAPATQDYFALVQRIDTLLDNGHLLPGRWDEVKEYLKWRFGARTAGQITDQVENSKDPRVFVAQVEDATAKLKIVLRGDANVRTSTFTLEKDNEPIYRRFYRNDKLDQSKVEEPTTLEFHRMNNEQEVLFENSSGDGKDEKDEVIIGSGGGAAVNLNDPSNKYSGFRKDSTEIGAKDHSYEISFLGVKNKSQFPSVKEDDPYGEIGGTNYAIYVDTAYINRGTGWIKPQYLLAVDVEEVGSCRPCLEGQYVDYPGYKIGRYLFNASMYAKEKATTDSLDYDKVQPVDYLNTRRQAYLWDNGYGYGWVRLAFAWSIHHKDKLYVLKSGEWLDIEQARLLPREGEQDLISTSLKAYKNKKYSISLSGSLTYLNFDLLEKEGKKDGILHAIIDLSDNKHKDWVFSFRFIERGSDDFVIESETTNRNPETGAVIRPGYGGWVKILDGAHSVPVITRSEQGERNQMGEAEIWNVKETSVKPVDNKPVEAVSAVKVVAGKGQVTILNAGGKKVVVSNLLGQKVVETTIASDNATIAVPSGVAIVVVEGASAVKAVVQ